MGIVELVNLIFKLLGWFILARVLMSYFRPDPYHPVVKLIIRVTDPILLPFQRIVPPVQQFDFSPLVAYIFLEYVARNLVLMLLKLVIPGVY